MTSPAIHEIPATVAPEALMQQFATEEGALLLQSAMPGHPYCRYSFAAVRPFLIFSSSGAMCKWQAHGRIETAYGDPWRQLEARLARFELPDAPDFPFPLGGCFGFWGYDLKNFVEPKLARRAPNDLELPDCWVGFYDSLVAFDHVLGRSWIVATGLLPDGTRSHEQARRQMDFWLRAFNSAQEKPDEPSAGPTAASPLKSTFTRSGFLAAVSRAQRYIQAGDIYQVNLSQRLETAADITPWDIYLRLLQASPAPYAAYLNAGQFQLASSSPEQFLRMDGPRIQTRPIKGTRPRSADSAEDARLAYELQTSTKETAELIMITDLLRNDLGKVCEFGSVNVPDLMRLERYPQVQHLVSTVEGQLKSGISHLEALRACFPGGSITGAPKFRAMEIIEELEPVARGPYTGSLGYLGFNRSSQFSIIIRTAICLQGRVYFPVGAGIVADSSPEAEYAETLDKAGGFLAALKIPFQRPLQTKC